MNNTCAKILICFLFILLGQQVDAQCGIDSTEVVITITTDNYPTETSWELIDQNGAGWTNVPLTVNDANTTITWTICVPNINCYSFTIFDSYGDGICCAWGNGSYNVTYGGSTVASGGSFLYSETTSSIGTCLPPTPSTPGLFCDDFESYSAGNNLAATSASWITWTPPYTASEDVQVTNTLSNSGSNSIFFNGTSSSGGPSDVVLPFGSSAPYTSGFFVFTSDFYVINGAYFNFQSEVITNLGWAFEADMTTSGVINFTNGVPATTLLSVNYPSNQWFELKMEIDLNANLWEVFIDGVSQGSFTNPTNKIASLDLFPLPGHQFYVDDVCYEYSTSPISTYGCTDSTATNYNPNATIDDSSCVYGPCGPDSTEIVITILTDDYPTETSWFLMDQFGGGWTNVPLTANDANTTITWTLCVPSSNCYTFTILDSWGDGLCFSYPSPYVCGSYNVTYGGSSVASGSTFQFVQEHCNIGSCIPNCSIVIPSNAIPEGEPCGVDANHGCDDNWKISNFTITGVTDIWSFGGFGAFANPFGSGCIHPGDDPDLYVYMRKNSEYFYYSGYYPNTWYPNNGFSCSSQPLSFSMYPNNITSPLEVPTRGLFTSPYVAGQSFNYEFWVGDDDQGSFLNIFGGNDYIGSYTFPSFTTASTFSITTSGGPDGNAYVDYTTIAPVTLYTPLTNGNVVHGTFWAENNVRDSDWYDFTINDTSTFSLNAISETPFNLRLMDASGGCIDPIAIDSAFGYGCDTVSIQQTLPPGTYWLLVLPTAYSCMDCSQSIDYLLDVDWIVGCNITHSVSVTPANCISANGSINLTVNGGSLPYSYLWSNGDTTQNLNNVPIGNYDVIINASNNCGDTISSIYVPDYPNPLSLTYTTIPESLAGSFDGSIDINVIGGVPTLSYSWTGPNLFSDTSQDINALESGMYYVTVTDINGCSFSDSIEVLEFSIDVGVSAFISPTNACNLDSVEQIVVQITNYNFLDAIDFVVSFQYNGQIYTDSITSNLAAGDSMIYTFNNTINASGSGSYSITSFTSHVLDNDNFNDSTAIIFTNYYHDFYSSDYSMSFEPYEDFGGWLIEDANNDLYSWNINQYTGFNQSYGAFYNYNFDGITAADDWLISQCFELDSGNTYTLGFKYRAASASFPEDMTINIGTAQQGSALNTMILQMNNIINIVYDSTQITFNVPTSGIYYIGWHAVSNANMWRIDLDDINISMNLPALYGCTDTAALNYNIYATVDDSSCIYCVYGCMDSTAFNYDSTATCDDLSCVSVMYGCTDSTAINYYAGANVDDGSCIYTLFGCTDPIATNYNPGALINDGSCIYAPGCMDSTAINYNPNVTINDSSLCIYPIYGCTDSTAINYDPLANTDDGSCQPYIYGCMDSLAINYYPAANADDGSCIYPVYGCTDSTAFNYNPLAAIDDSSCVAIIYGCTDSCNACNYNPLANTDDGSCIYSIACSGLGCTDPLAINYDSTAICNDGSCIYATCGPITGVNMTDVIHDRATFNWDNMNSSTCQVDQIRFRYREVGTSSYSTKTMGVPVGSGCNTSNTSKLVLGLTPNTTYEYDFKIWYCNALTVNWHANGSFTTQAQCDNVINVIPTPITTTKTEFCWDSVSTYSFVRLKYRIDSAGTTFYNIGGMGVFSPQLCKEKNGLTPGTSYRAMWRTWCNPMGGPYRSPQWDGPVLWTQPTSIRSNTSRDINSIDIFPNPTRGKFDVIISIKEGQKANLSIYNVLGESITQIVNIENNLRYSFNLSHYPKGVYTIAVNIDGDTHHKRLVVQ